MLEIPTAPTAPPLTRSQLRRRLIQLYSEELANGTIELAMDHDISGVGAVHGEVICMDDDYACSVHRPSDHPLKDARRHFRTDRNLMERICEHGTGHPDPDGLEFLERHYGEDYPKFAFGVHGCDGCCA